MAFGTYQPPTPAGLGTLAVTLKTSPATGTEPATQSAQFSIEVLDAEGNRIGRPSGNLVPHLTQAQINALLGFMADLRTQAEEQIL
ncbi:hypothetical protein KC887_01160 [Candidatus Kaiserbacteria bacterium]|nr:hypothetical protein [Candidatus Kaiserbacteria bacterium]